MDKHMMTALPQVRWRCLLCDKVVGDTGDPCRCEKTQDNSVVCAAHQADRQEGCVWCQRAEEMTRQMSGEGVR
jgi:hypothetical protein